MTIASKSSGLILKSGALATNCGCCVGWYCCNTAPSNVFCDIGILVRVSVSVTAPDYFKRVSESWNVPCFDQFGNFKGPIASRRTTYTFGSHLSGTFVLSSAISSSQAFSYAYTNTDRIGCGGHRIDVVWYRENRTINGSIVPVIVFDAPAIMCRVFEHTKIQTSPPPVSSAGEGDMTCGSTATGAYPCSSNYPADSPRVQTSSSLGTAFTNADPNDTEPFGRIVVPGPCFAGTITKNYSMTYPHPVHVQSGDARGPVGNFQIISEEGSLSGSVSVTVEFL
jgi:hypothetical protein